MEVNRAKSKENQSPFSIILRMHNACRQNNSLQRGREREPSSASHAVQLSRGEHRGAIIFTSAQPSHPTPAPQGQAASGLSRLWQCLQGTS